MKHVLTLVAALIAVSQAQAKTVCNINTGNEQTMVFDKILFTGELTSSAPRYFVVKNGGAQEIQLEASTKLSEFKSLDHSTIVSLSEAGQGEVSLTVGHIDLSRRSNVIPTDAAAFGPVVDQKVLSLMIPGKNLSVMCVSRD